MTNGAMPAMIRQNVKAIPLKMTLVKPVRNAERRSVTVQKAHVSDLMSI